jgi:hypothetical protein
MQPTIQYQEYKHLFASRVIKDLERKAHIKMNGKVLNFVTEKNDGIAQLIREYEGIEKWINTKKADNPAKYTPILKRIKSEAIGIMIRCNEVNESQLKSLGLTKEDILFETELRELLADWVELETDESLIAREGLRKVAIGGELMDYSRLSKLYLEYDQHCEDEKKHLKSNFQLPSDKEKYDENGNEIIYPTEESMDQSLVQVCTNGFILKYQPTHSLKDCINRKIELQKLITDEKRILSEKKSLPQNLCYYLLYDEVYKLNPGSEQFPQREEDFELHLVEDNDKIIKRVRGLGKYYLKIMIGIICKINNEHYESEIAAANNLRKKMNRQTNKMSIQDKIELIQLGKSEGLTNKEISKLLGKGFGLRTVERYSK